MLKKKFRTLIKSNKFKYISYILIGQICFLIANLYVNFKVENRWGSEGFASFSLIKRTTSFIVFPILIGAGIAIPRFISFLKEKTNQRSLEIFLSGIFTFSLSFSLVALIILFFPKLLTSAFQDTGFSETKISLVFLTFILSQGTYLLLFSYYRGRLEFKYSTILNILIMSFIPVVLIFFSGNILNYFIELGTVSLIILFSHIVFKTLINKVSFQNIKEDRKKLFLYGFPRVPGEIALYALDFIPVYLVSVFIGLNESGYISMTLLFFKMGGMLFELVGSIVLPYFGKMFINHNSSYFIDKVETLVKYGFIGGIIVSIPFYFGCRFMIEYFFPSQVFAINITKAVFFVFPVYVIYILLRNILDIVKTKAYNSINLTVVSVLQMLILFVGFYFNNPNIYYKLALLIPYFILGLITYLTWIKLRKKLESRVGSF